MHKECHTRRNSKFCPILVLVITSQLTSEVLTATAALKLCLNLKQQNDVNKPLKYKIVFGECCKHKEKVTHKMKIYAKTFLKARHNFTEMKSGLL
jgi:hypothetical protein